MTDTPMSEVVCLRCGQVFLSQADDDPWSIESAGEMTGMCPPCARLFPPALLKASMDPFDYALGLRTGEVIRFHECSLAGEWVHLTIEGTWGEVPTSHRRVPYQMDRGIDVRLADIVWCADAPEGS